MVPLIRRKFVDELAWIDEDEMMDLISIAQSAPGAIAINTSFLAGHRVAGICGALVSVLGAVFPPLVIISAISFLYKTLSFNPVAHALLSGILCAVAALVLNAAIEMGFFVAKQRRIFPLVLLSASFAAVHFFAVNLFFVILAGALLGALDAVIFNKKRNLSDPVAADKTNEGGESE